MADKNTSTGLGHIFHVSLTDKFENEDYWLHVAGKKYPLVMHSPESLAIAHAQEPTLAAYPQGHITHYTQVPVKIPLNKVIRISVRHTNYTGVVPGDFGVHLVAIHIVPNDEAHQLMATQNQVKVVSQPIDYVTTAKALVFHHADLITANSDYAPIVMEHMDQVQAPSTYLLIQQLATQMRLAGPPTANSGWATYQAYDAGAKGTKQTLVPTDSIMQQAGASMTSVQVSTKNDTRLQGTSWTQETGTSVQSSTNTNTPELLTSVKADAVGGDNWTAALANTNTANGLETSIKVLNSGTRQVQITMNNYYVRWLGAYIQFVDADGNAISTPTWQPDDGGIVADIANILNLNYDNMRFIGWINPINTVYAIPIAADPGTLTVSITFPENAVSANLFGCGLGTGNNQYPKTPIVGGVFTGLANLGIPTFLLGFGVAANSCKGLYDAMGNPTFIKAVVAIGALYFGGDFIYNGAVNKKMDWHAFSSLTQILFNQACTKALVWCEEQIAEGEIEDEIPFAGWIMLAINIAATIAQLAETIIEVATSPWMITNSISTTITSTLTIYPDPRHGAFPALTPGAKQASYVTKMIYQQQNRPSITTTSVITDPNAYPPTLPAQFTNTLGGQVKFEVDFYIDNWLAGKATTSWLENNEDNTANIVLYLFQQPIPLTNKSIYAHTAILGYQNNAYTWIPQTTPPNATIANTDTSQSGNALSDWTGLAISQRSGMIGLAWKAAGMGITDCSTGAGGQLYAFQNIDIPGTAMNSVKFPSCGFTSPSELVYDVYPPKFLMENGQFVVVNGNPVPDPTDVSLGNYYVDPRKADNDQDVDGGYHLRQVTLDASTPFNMSPDQNSFGRFPYYPDSIAMHPSGNVVGVNRKYCKMMITPLAGGTGLADNNIPLAVTFAGQALNYNNSNGRPGLLFTPVAVTCSYDGTILVLEQLSSQGFNIARLQAFDLNGNPVNCFQDGSGDASPFLLVPSNVTYLDVAAVGDNYTTYLYVLFYANDGSHVSDYSMAIYQYGQGAPAGNLLVTTPNIPAARLNVDMWHTLYTLNYAMTQDGKGNNAGPAGGTGTGPAGVTVPSVSEWLPPLPS
ncbi:MULTISPECIES: hypothetical protein [Niastella]|uniref:Uncharacterized protein n=1 Tax=Niastella soli TaxID=2821487 RepID=A0ABS3YW59_9BACT|nr:hypothetical protein [Niastella soli]MBO9202155.1 hypothetical protein [Niastella soli]